MTNNKRPLCQMGMIGLGVMGRNLLLNMADHGFNVAGYDRDKEKVNSLKTEAKEKNVYTAQTIEEFLNLLQKPRAIMLLVPAGKPVDMVINELIPHLDPNDMIIDAGNSHFIDTDMRMKQLQEKNMYLLGVGISGGEEGARLGPSIMPGGSREAYERVRPILEAVAASVDEDPCVTYLGPGSVGHYVKMVHNGIEYGIMQLIAETYDLMKRGLHLDNEQLHAIYESWNQTELNSYLLEITSDIFSRLDDKTHTSLIDKIKSIAKQNGTGMWTSQSAMELQVPTATIDTAVMMRDLSVLIKERESANKLYQHSIKKISVDSSRFIKQIKNALFSGMIMVYAQGMALLKVASEKYSYHLDLESVARIWRGGCIIRAALLEDIMLAFHANKNLPNLLLDPALSKKMMAHQEDLRQVICNASTAGISMPALTMSLSYFDAYCSLWSPANLIQAQRDYFGAHQYERNDCDGIFHTQWKEESVT